MQIKPVVVRGSTVPQNSTCGSLSVAVWNLKIHQQAYHIGTFKSVGLSCVLTGSFIHTLFFKILCIDTFKNIGSLSTGWHNIKKITFAHITTDPGRACGFWEAGGPAQSGNWFQDACVSVNTVRCKARATSSGHRFYKILFFCLSVYALSLAMPQGSVIINFTTSLRAF